MRPRKLGAVRERAWARRPKQFAQTRAPKCSPLSDAPLPGPRGAKALTGPGAAAPTENGHIAEEVPRMFSLTQSLLEGKRGTWTQTARIKKTD